MKKTNSKTLITLLVAVVISPTTSVNAQRGNGDGAKTPIMEKSSILRQ